jgi:hypothetical protein
MGNLSFDLKDHHDYLMKLDAEYADLEANRLSSRHAVNFAMTAYHMWEWVWAHEAAVNTHPDYPEPKKFYGAINHACGVFRIMQDVTNGSKHAVITQGRPKVQGAELHEGSFDDTFDSSFDTTGLVVKMVDGTVHDFFDDATVAVKFWRGFFLAKFRL